MRMFAQVPSSWHCYKPPLIWSGRSTTLEYFGATGRVVRWTLGLYINLLLASQELCLSHSSISQGLSLGKRMNSN